jgi:hypothetical protein
VSQEEHDEIRELWKKHSIAEDKRDLPGLISTLTEDCVYEVRPDGARWEGTTAPRASTPSCSLRFPDIHFDLTDIVIGPQGVCEWARVTGTHSHKWLDYEPTGESLTWNVVILFPWDRDARLFKGEKVYSDASLTQLSMR